MITKSDGVTKPEDGSMVTPINMPPSSIFKTVQVRVNGTPIMASDEYYWLKSYISTLLSTTRPAKEAQMSGGQGWHV